jgi:hypothetical protein
LPDVDTYFGTDPRSRCIGPGSPECESAGDCPAGFLCLNAGSTKRCLPGLVACTGRVTCPADPVACPVGYMVSIVDECYGPCVSIDRCACENDSDCGSNIGAMRASQSCDRVAGRCRIEQAPSPRCFVRPPEVTCNPSAPQKYSLVDGYCQLADCPDPANSFDSPEACWSACYGMPIEKPCPAGYRAIEACLACANLGCAERGPVCAKICETGDDCTIAGEGCLLDGTCQIGCSI